jgi:5S rRNA maturation endonuclease (ribonuclease M5)
MEKPPMGDVNGQWSEYKEKILGKIADFRPLFSEVKNQKPSGDGWISGLCPLHEDREPSFAFNQKTGQWVCFARCGKGSVFDFIAATTGRSFKDALIELGDRLGVPRPIDGKAGCKTGRAGKSRPAIAEDLIQQWNRALLDADDLRFELGRRRGISDKTIARHQLGWDKQRRRYTIPVRDRSGRVVNVRLASFDERPKIRNYTADGHRYGTPPRLYGVNDLVKSDTRQVILCEGEWDRLLLCQLGFVAVTGTHGAGTFLSEWTVHFAGKDVVVLFDCDETGKAAAEKVVATLAGAGAASVKDVTLPLSGTGDDKDVSDYFLRHFKTAPDLQALIDETPAHQQVASSKPVISTNRQQLESIIIAAWDGILAGNNPPHLFLSNGQLARIADLDTDPHIELLTESMAYGLLTRTATWTRDTKEGPRDAKPPKEVAADLLAFPQRELPVLAAVVSTPVFAANGQLIVEPGYHRRARLWYHQVAGFRLPPVAANPSRSDREEALGLLLKDLLVDFPFTAQSDRAHALATLLLPFARRLIDGCTPIALIEAPIPGSGKTLLSDLVSILALGRPCEPTTVTRNEDEIRKKVTALLARGMPIILLDNVKDALESGQLAAALTAEIWADRILGQTRIIMVPNRATWLVTANNPRLSMEIARRCVRIRIDPGNDRPWERTKFEHDPLREWARQNRPRLIHALLTLIQAWLAAGRPVGGRSLGSFESWATVIGGILKHAGVEGFLEDTTEFYQTADPEGQQWAAFVEVWHGEHGDRWVTTAELLELADQRDLLGFLLTAKTERGQKTSLGRALNGMRDRRFGDLKLVTGTDGHRKVAVYRLVPIAEDLFKSTTTGPKEQKCGTCAGLMRD